MILAQKLYEGVELEVEEGAVGLISYMRTDSTRVSNDALGRSVRGMIVERYGADITARRRPTPMQSKKATRRTPTKPFGRRPRCRTPESVEKFVAEDELKLYRLIWMRFVASQMTPAVFDQTSIDVEAKGRKMARRTCSARPAASRSSTDS